MFLHRTILFILAKTRKAFPSNQNVLSASKADQAYYIAYIHSSVHAVFSVIGAVYGLLYADGQHGTTWFHCNYYKLNMFDSQKYFSMASLGFFAQDFFFVLTT